ncbi:unnamed protein product [Amoebophrya sp. A25]|nr:unnamed protein product [Amoebophrya sp. A25]|eukprot:GSA25T00022215001.1
MGQSDGPPGGVQVQQRGIGAAELQAARTTWYEGENDYFDERDAAAALFDNVVAALQQLPLDQTGQLTQFKDDGSFVSPGEFPAHAVSWWVGGEPEDLMSVLEGGVSAAELDQFTQGPEGWTRLSRWDFQLNGGAGGFLDMEVVPGLGQRVIGSKVANAGRIDGRTVRMQANLLTTNDNAPRTFFTLPPWNSARFPESSQWRRPDLHPRAVHAGVGLESVVSNGQIVVAAGPPLASQPPLPPKNLGKVFQGNLANGYLIDALNAMSARPELVYNTFLRDDRDGAVLSNVALGLYQFRLYKHADWVSIAVDDYLPQSNDAAPMGCRGEYFPHFGWASLLEKAYAKLHSSWMATGRGGNIEEALEDFTGGIGNRFYVKDIAPDRLYAYLDFALPRSVLSAKLDAEQAARLRLKLDPEFSYTIVQTKSLGPSGSENFVCLYVNCPDNTVLAQITGLQDTEYLALDGYVWMEALLFHTCFKSIHECRLVNSELPFVWRPAWTGLVEAGPAAELTSAEVHKFLFPSPHSICYKNLPSPVPAIARPRMEEQIWCFPSEVSVVNWPVFRIEVLGGHVPCELYCSIGQSDKRLGGFLDDEEPHLPIFLKLFEEMGRNNSVSRTDAVDVTLAAVSGWGHTRDSTVAVKVNPTGQRDPEETAGRNTVLYVSVAVCGTDGAYEPAQRLIARFYSLGSSLHVEEISENVKRRRPQLVEIVADRRLSTIPWSFSGWTADISPRPFDEMEGQGRQLRHPAFECEMWQDATILKRKAAEDPRLKRERTLFGGGKK